MDYDREYHSIQLLSTSEILEIYYLMLKMAMESSSQETRNKNGFDGRLNEESLQNLAGFCEKNSTSPFSQVLAECVTYLEWCNEKKAPPIQETTLYNAFVRLEKAVNKTSSWELYGEDYDGPLINISSFEVNMLEQNISIYIMNMLSETESQPLFFPLNDLHNPDVIVKWRILERIAIIRLVPHETIYKQKLKEYMAKRIKFEVNSWLDKEIQKLKLSGKHSVLKDTEVLTKILKELKSHVIMSIDVIASEVLFDEAGCSYFENLTQAVDEKLYPVCQEIVDSMDVYQQSYKSFHVNMRDSCALLHAFYLQLKELSHLLVARVKKVEDLKLKDYSSMFGKFFMNLLQVMKSECHHRIKRAVETETKDTVHSEEKILSSSVIVLNCCCTVIDEWKRMEIEDEELQIAFLVKVADIVCDGAKIYAEALERRLENRNPQQKESDFMKKACILANSVEHVRKYLAELPQQMQWVDSVNVLSGDPSNASLKEQVLRILNLIHQSMDSQLSNITVKLLSIVVSWVQTNFEKPISSWLQVVQNTSQSFDKVMNFLNETMESLHQVLKDELFPRFLSLMWCTVLTSIKNGFQEGQPPEYAKTIKENVLKLKEYFEYIGMEESDVHKPMLQQIMDLLYLNSKTTVELQLEYYSQVAESIISPIEYLGHIAFQAGYKMVGTDIVDLYINVQKGQRLPARKFEMAALNVKVELCPNTLFPNQLPFKSSAVTEDLTNPMFNAFFQFPKLPSSILNVRGAVVQVLVLNQDYSYSAEAILLLNLIQNTSGLASLEFLPVYLMPLRKFDMSHISYQVLENRSRWDKNAKIFISKRAKLNKSHKKLLPCIPGKSMMCHYSAND